MTLPASRACSASSRRVRSIHQRPAGRSVPCTLPPLAAHSPPRPCRSPHAHALHPDLCRPKTSTPPFPDFPGFAKDNGAFCATLPLAPEVVKVLEAETLRAGEAESVCFFALQSKPAVV